MRMMYGMCLILRLYTNVTLSCSSLFCLDLSRPVWYSRVFESLYFVLPGSWIFDSNLVALNLRLCPPNSQLCCPALLSSTVLRAVRRICYTLPVSFHPCKHRTASLRFVEITSRTNLLVSKYSIREICLRSTVDRLISSIKMKWFLEDQFMIIVNIFVEQTIVFRIFY